MGSLKDYGGISRQTIDKEREQIDQDKPPSVFLGLDDGETAVFRILPGRPGEEGPFHSFWKHTYTDPVTQQFVAFACPRKNPPGTGACPVCEQSTVLLARGRASKVDNDIGYALSPKKRVLVNIYLYEIQKSGGKSEVRNEVLVWEFGSGNKGRSQHEELLDIADNQRAGGDYVDPLNGFPFMLARTGKNKNDTTYKLTPLYGERGPLLDGSEDEILSVLERMHDLAGVCLPPSPEDMRAILSQGQGPARGPQPAARPVVSQGQGQGPARGSQSGPAPARTLTTRASLPLPAAPPTAAKARPTRTAADYMSGQTPAKAHPTPPVEVAKPNEDWGNFDGGGDDDIPW